VTLQIKRFDSPKVLAHKIQDGILIKFQLPCSIGIAHNKSIAKIASDHNKPRGITYVPYSEFKRFLEPLPVGRINGVGPKTEEILNNKNIYTISELAVTSKQVLQSILGKYGLYLYDIANGLEREEVTASEWQRSSSSREFTFAEDTKDFDLIEKQIKYLAMELVEYLKEKGLYYKTVTIKIRFEDFDTMTRSKSLSLHSISIPLAQKLALELLREFKDEWRKVRLIGVKLSNLKQLDEEQSTLLKWQ
jgi:nucleotidyltransferase/DNA polymerase involved in DNA repair